VGLPFTIDSTSQGGAIAQPAKTRWLKDHYTPPANYYGSFCCGNSATSAAQRGAILCTSGQTVN
jgi:hypothetical protein